MKVVDNDGNVALGNRYAQNIHFRCFRCAVLQQGVNIIVLATSPHSFYLDT